MSFVISNTNKQMLQICGMLAGLGQSSVQYLMFCVAIVFWNSMHFFNVVKEMIAATWQLYRIFFVLLLTDESLQHHERSTASLAYLAHIIYYLQTIFMTTSRAAYSSLPWVWVHILFQCIAVNISYLLTMLNTLTLSILSVVLITFFHLALKFRLCNDRNNSATYK